MLKVPTGSDPEALSFVPDNTPLEELIAISVLLTLARNVKEGQEVSETMLKVLRQVNKTLIMSLASRAMKDTGITHTSLEEVKATEAALLKVISNEHFGPIEKGIAVISDILVRSRTARRASRQQAMKNAVLQPLPISSIPVGALKGITANTGDPDWKRAAKELFEEKEE